MIVGKKECDGCLYSKGWDCKNCFVHNSDDTIQTKTNVLFTIILTRQCNFRCNYCTIDFTDDNLGYTTIDNFIASIYKNREAFGEITFEFFGGEPLLEFEKIKYIVENTRNLGVTYTTYTNGHLFQPDIIQFLHQNDFREVIFSVSSHNMRNLLSRKQIFSQVDVSFITVNFILEPGCIEKMFGVFVDLINLGFRKFSMIPVHHTKFWNKTQLIGLDATLKKINALYYKSINTKYQFQLFYFKTNDESERGIQKQDLEFILDWDGKIYADYEAELYLLKDMIKKEVFHFSELFITDVNQGDLDVKYLFSQRRLLNAAIISSLKKINEEMGASGDMQRTGKIIEINRI